MRCLAVLLVFLLPCGVFAGTIESPKKEQVFKRGDKIVCAGTMDEATAILVKVKNKKDVTYGNAGDTHQGGPWTLTVEPPTGGWPAGEYTIELHNARRKRIDATVKIKVE